MIDSHDELISTIKNASPEELPGLAQTIKSASFSAGHLSLVHTWEMKVMKHGSHGHGVTEHLAAQKRIVSDREHVEREATLAGLQQQTEKIAQARR